MNELAKANGALNERGEYTRWLHLWAFRDQTILDRPQHDRHVTDVHYRLAWPRPGGMIRPDFEALMAFYHVTGFAGWPDGWVEFPWMVESVADGHARALVTHWVVLADFKDEQFYTWLIGHKRAARTAVFKQFARPGDPKFDRIAYHRAERDALLKSLEPYLIRRSTNEANGPDQDGCNTVRDG